MTGSGLTILVHRCGLAFGTFIFGWSHMKVTLEYFVKIADVTEADGNCQVGNAVGIWVLMLDQLGGMENTVF